MSFSKKNKKLAVIIPNFNKKKYISTTIKSILKQTLLPNEIIIVDDHSTDESKDIIKKFEKKYPQLIKAFYFNQNKGVQYCRNFGVSQTKSEYITFIDSDDFYYSKNKLKNEMKHVTKKRIVYSQFCFYDNLKEKYSFQNYEEKKFKQFKKNTLLFYLDHIQGQYWPYGFIVNKINFKKIGGYNFPYNYYEDLDLLIKFYLLGLEPFLINDIGYSVRLNCNDVTHLSNNIHLKKDVFHILRKKYYKKNFYLKRIYYKLYFFYRRCFLYFKKYFIKQIKK